MTHLDRPLLIHVAAESEGRGRVVLAARSATPHRAALQAAFDVARAFETWVDCLLIESPDVVALTAHSFARGIGFDGRISPLSSADVSDWQAASSAAARKAVVAAAAQSTGIRLETQVTRDGLADALSRACAIEGPWNVVVLADCVTAAQSPAIEALMGGVSGATGVVCVGPAAVVDTSQRGPVVVVVEDLDRLSQMLRAAERLAACGPGVPRAVELVVAGDSQAQSAELDGHLRLLLADVPADPASPVSIAASGPLYGTDQEIAEAVRRREASFVIGRVGGQALPADATSSSLIAVSRCPLLLVR